MNTALKLFFEIWLCVLHQVYPEYATRELQRWPDHSETAGRQPCGFAAAFGGIRLFANLTLSSRKINLYETHILLSP